MLQEEAGSYFASLPFPRELTGMVFTNEGSSQSVKSTDFTKAKLLSQCAVLSGHVALPHID